jgi:hypothetical protein
MQASQKEKSYRILSAFFNPTPQGFAAYRENKTVKKSFSLKKLYRNIHAALEAEKAEKAHEYYGKALRNKK